MSVLESVFKAEFQNDKDKRLWSQVLDSFNEALAHPVGGGGGGLNGGCPIAHANKKVRLSKVPKLFVVR